MRVYVKNIEYKLTVKALFIAANPKTKIRLTQEEENILVQFLAKMTKCYDLQRKDGTDSKLFSEIGMYTEDYSEVPYTEEDMMRMEEEYEKNKEIHKRKQEAGGVVHVAPGSVEKD